MFFSLVKQDRDHLKRSALLVGILAFFAVSHFSQQTTDQPTIVQPGAPGQPSKKLPSSTRPTLPGRSAKDVEFMQGMIMHHAQAVEMTALIEARTENKDIRLLGARISQSQSDEMEFMKRWLQVRGGDIIGAKKRRSCARFGFDGPSLDAGHAVIGSDGRPQIGKRSRI